MASSKCTINSCKRDFDMLCGHCQKNVCPKHYIEHLKSVNQELIPLADNLNCIVNDIQQGVPLQDALNKLEQWRSHAHQQVNEVCNNTKQHIQQIVEIKLSKQMKKLHEIRQEVKELIDEGDASFKQVKKIKAAINECQERYSYVKEACFVKMELKPIEMLLQIPDETLFNGGALLIEEHQEKLNEFYGKWNTKWVLIYKATKDGFRSTDFHQHCNNQGPTMTIIQSKTSGYLFGGYTSISWISKGYYVADSNGPFLFTLTNPHGIPPAKYQIARPEYAIHDLSGYGPTFGGGHDIYICDQSDTTTGSYSNFPHSYSDRTGNGNATFTGNKNFQTSDIEVYRLV